MCIRSRLVRFGAALAAVAAAGLIALPSQAQARVFFGFGFAFPGFYYPPPLYYPPPYYPPVVYAPPPPVIYAPPPVSYGPATIGGRCIAGPYVCPMQRPTPVGNACYCRSNSGGRVWGRVS
jgi:hypothetical protein